MDYTDTLMWKELHESPSNLKKLMEINEDTLRALAGRMKISGIKFIYTAARGTSDHAMMYFKYIAETMLGIPVASGAPSVMTVYGGKPDFSGALILACSQSGKAADVMEIVKRGNECGAVTAAITNDPDSPLARLAQYHLFCAAGEEKSVAATKTFISQLFLCLALVCTIKNNDKDGLCAYAAKYLEESFPAIEESSRLAADKLDSMDECFTLARGISSAIAFECALKLQETCYIRARAYHSSDFYHGPMAMVDNGVKVILFASKHSASGADDSYHAEDEMSCAMKMMDIGADLYVVTDRDDMPGNIIRIPEAICEQTAVFGFAVFAQLLACCISHAKGLNPDCPRALKKVTVTR